MALLEGGQIGAGEEHSPDFAGDGSEQSLRRSVGEQAAVREDGDVGGDGLDVRDDVRGEDDDALAGKLGEEIAEAHALFGIETRGGLIHDEELGVVEKRLCDADALAHAAREPSKRTMARIREIHHDEEFVYAVARGGAIETLDRGKVFEEFIRSEMRIHAEILRQITENGAQRIGRRENVQVIPVDGASGGARDGG